MLAARLDDDNLATEDTEDAEGSVSAGSWSSLFNCLLCVFGVLGGSHRRPPRRSSLCKVVRTRRESSSSPCIPPFLPSSESLVRTIVPHRRSGSAPDVAESHLLP